MQSLMVIGYLNIVSIAFDEKEFGIDKEALIKKGKKRNKTRDMAIYLSRNHCGIPCKELGMYFGNVSGATITMAYNRVEKGNNSK